MPFCQLQEDHISLSLLHVRNQQEEPSGLGSPAPCLARKHQGSSVLLKLASLESTKCSGALGRQIPWGDGLAILSSKRIADFGDTYGEKMRRNC